MKQPGLCVRTAASPSCLIIADLDVLERQPADEANARTGSATARQRPATRQRLSSKTPPPEIAAAAYAGQWICSIGSLVFGIQSAR